MLVSSKLLEVEVKRSMPKRRHKQRGKGKAAPPLSAVLPEEGAGGGSPPIKPPVPPSAPGVRKHVWEAVEPPLLPSTLSVVTEMGFTSMTPVQAATLPLFMKNKDVCVEAVTGSGKTLAFVIPIVERLQRLSPPLKPHQVGAVIVSPTRELAVQTYRVLSGFLSYGLSAIQLVGGTDVGVDLACAAAGCNIIVATPGRLLDVMTRLSESPTTVVTFKSLDVLVLDEADTLLDLGFHATLNDIMSRLPKQRRTGLFSATQTREVKALARAGMRNPVVVSVQVRRKGAPAEGEAGAPTSALETNQKTPTTLRNHFCLVPYGAKPTELVAFLNDHVTEKCIVFFLTCACVDFYAKALPMACKALLPPAGGFPIVALHGKMSQPRRNKSFAAFKAAAAGALFCTDVAARGLDLPDVDWILQFDPPQNPSFFVHRVGRTARAGRRGNAMVYLDPSEKAYIQLLALHQVPIERRAPLWSAFMVARAEGAARAGAGDAGAGGEGEPPSPLQSPVLANLKALAKTDRDVLEKGTQAFVAFVRGYKEHHCQFVFRLDLLDLAAVATSFALLKLPHVAELRGRKVVFEEDTSVDTSTIPYKDKRREEQRQASLAADNAKREAQRAARVEKQKKQARAAANPKPRKRKGRNKRMHEEWDRLAFEETLAKRVKRGKMTWDEFDKALRNANCDSEAEVGDSESETD